jgi:putative ubiquitin-RnfH superfamily antitoxin RatB of RatAB toxin-antitoxin module
MHIELVYALPEVQTLLSFQVNEGASVQQAIEQSGILKKYPEIDLQQNKIGIFGKITKLNVILREKDRIEIYRELIADPKAVRKARAAEGKIMRGQAKKGV